MLLLSAYLDATASNAGSAVETAAKHNTAKFANIETQFLFQPIAVE